MKKRYTVVFMWLIINIEGGRSQKYLLVLILVEIDFGLGIVGKVPLL